MYSARGAMGVEGVGGCPVPCSRAPRQGPGGELGPLQVAVHTPYLGLFGDLPATLLLTVQVPIKNIGTFSTFPANNLLADICI